jgi:hypothetical protein
MPRDELARIVCAGESCSSREGADHAEQTICHCGDRWCDGRPDRGQAQTTITTGTAGGSTVVIGEHEGIVAAQRPAFREYIVRERVPNYTISERVTVGAVLPETGVTYYSRSRSA